MVAKKDPDSLAARRARLRGSLSRAASESDEDDDYPKKPKKSAKKTAEMPAARLPDPGFYDDPEDIIKHILPDSIATPASLTEPLPPASSATREEPPENEATMSPPPPAPTVLPDSKSNELSDEELYAPGGLAYGSIDSVKVALASIEESLSACATNLAALQSIGSEQKEVMSLLSEKLQKETLHEIGLNLSNLTESLSAALEPMKAAGELIPAIDQLIAALEASEEKRAKEKITPDILVTNLSDQLSTGAIDPWTFKCAYVAIFPDDHPADLLRRLVELLGTQRLSGDLFRSAYEAVQAADPPSRSGQARPGPGDNASAASTGQTSDSSPAAGKMDEEVRAELEALRKANEELRHSMEEREDEYEELLAQKDQEIQEAQDLLSSRHEEFATRYEEVTEALGQREEEYQNLLENKDMEITEKDSQLEILRSQMEELRSQTEDMVKDLQGQMIDIKAAKDSAAEAKKQEEKAGSNFFDTAPSSGSGLFDAAPEKSRSDSNSFTTAPQPAPQPSPQVQNPNLQRLSTPEMPPAPQPAPQPLAQPAQQLAAQPASTDTQRLQAVSPQPAGGAATTPFTGGGTGTGSYGSGVRAQVFEVIVRQALAGAPWREICAGPMQVNNISPDEVEAEVQRRQAMLQ